MLVMPNKTRTVIALPGNELDMIWRNKVIEYSAVLLVLHPMQNTDVQENDVY
jgi:hypothetical protein